jgi:hypothetical protein
LECILTSLHNSQFNRRWALVIVLAAVGFATYLGWRYIDGTVATKATEVHPAIPVTVAQARTADFPVYLNGLGTVEPFVTVTVRSRVDGEVTKVAFKQGQMVKEGDLLVQIDPRPYQAALDQALSNKARHEANLKEAQVDLQRYTTLAKQDSIARQQLDTQQSTSTGCPGYRPHQPRRYRDRGKSREARRCGLSRQAGKCQRRRRGRGFARHRPDEDRVAHKADVRQWRSSRAHSAHL